MKSTVENLELEISKLSFEKNDLLIIKIPIELLGAMNPKIFHNIVETYKAINLQIMVLPTEVDFTKLSEQELERLNLKRINNMAF